MRTGSVRAAPGTPMGFVVVVAFLSAILWVSASGQAWGHTRLEASEPAADDTVSVAVDVVVLIFNEVVSDEFAEVQVTGPGGDRVDVGPPRMAGERVEQQVDTVTESGQYSVTWRVVARDGHPLEGTFVFVYEPADDVEVMGEVTERGTSEHPPADEVPEVAAPEDEHEAADLLVRPSGPEGATWPLAAAVVVVASALGAVVHAVRRVRAWPPGPAARAGP